MQYNKLFQFKTTEADYNKIKQEAETYRMPLSTYVRLKVLNNEIQLEKQESNS